MARERNTTRDFAAGRNNWYLILLVTFSLVILSGCAARRRLAAVPDALDERAYVPGMDIGIRYFPRDSAHVQLFVDDYLKSLEVEKAYLATQGHTGPLPSTAFLAISGGGDNGAFAAGFLNGWTQTGTRPQFKLVTGISTGALIAPFAFLGPAYDKELKELYTGISFKDVAVLVQSEMEKNIFPLVKIPPLRGGDFQGMRIHRPMPVSRSFALAR